MEAALARHDEIMRAAVESREGYVVKTTGDGFHAAFATADAGVGAAVAAQAALEAETWGVTGRLRVRMGLHTGVASYRDGDYYGGSLNRAARLMSVAHGGQLVVSQATADLARGALPAGVELVDLGEHRPVTCRDRARVPGHCGRSGSGVCRLTSLNVSGNLPAQMTSFVGRRDEIAVVSQALDEARLVTLTGAGRVGKTRLAIRAAAGGARVF
jgi:hypothetical protein